METGIESSLAALQAREESAKRPAEYSPLVLAYLGDAVYELYIRSHLVSQGNYPVNRLHKAAISYVKAEAQSAALSALEPELTEEELRIYKRGRNAKPGTVAKHADVKDYHRATGFEALVGYLYLDGQTERLGQVLAATVRALDHLDLKE
ncbi:MAG: ribonuclease III domain-containing protein [Clostridia bacterium]|nr:ribonuclease III domain-containing protein [Clostridia bacterium]